MDEIEKILEKLNNLENTVNKLKQDLENIQLNQDNEDENQQFREFFKDSLLSSNELFGVVKEIRRQLRRTFRKRFKQSFTRTFDNDVDFDLSFDFSNLGDFINDTVHSALSSLDGLFDSLDFENSPRKTRVRVQPGTNITFDFPNEHEYEVLPELSDKNNAEILLKILEQKISSELDLREKLSSKFDDEKLISLLKELKDKKLIIQEKSGNQRFMLSKLGRKLLKELESQQNNKDENN